MTTMDEYTNSAQQTDLNDNIIQISNYLSAHHIRNHEVYLLNLDRCLIQPYVIENISNSEIITSISLCHNYLLQVPKFVSNHTNLIELNVSHNNLCSSDFLLYKPLDDSELTETYWNETLKTHCYAADRISMLSYKENQSKPLIQTFRPLVHPFLENINLSHNHIQTLPANVHYLRFLHTINLSHNHLEEIPDNICNMEQLNTLIIDHNTLKMLPNRLNRLIQLEHLNLSHNHLESIDVLKNLPKLRTLSANGNPIKVYPALLNTCQNLEEIIFSNVPLDQMKSVTFETFTQYSKLRKLDLSKNHLKNEFFLCNIEPLDNLEELYLENNQLTSIGSLLSTMKSLRLLDLSHNSLSSIPTSFYTNLEILRLSHNYIELSPNDCIQLEHIIELNLDHNQIKQIPNEFIYCQELQTLHVTFNPFSRFPEILCELRSLNRLIISHSKFISTSSMDFFRKNLSQTLHFLDLSNNHLHSNLHELTILTGLTHLDLSWNQLHELSDDFKTLSCLKVLKLNKNHFTNFPSCLHEMSTNSKQKSIGESLLELNIGDNKLTAIPEDIVHIINLETIDLSNNQFPGFPDALIYLEQLSTIIYSQEHGIHINKLPDDFTQLCNLKKLDLSHNIFDEISPIIYTLTQLEYLNMSHNLLTGIDYDRLPELTHLKTIKLNTNKFTWFSSAIYRFEHFDISDNPDCLAPPSDFHDSKYLSANSNLFLRVNDEYEGGLFEIYQKIFVENFPSVDIERLMIRFRISKIELNHLQNDFHRLKRENKIELLLNIWKRKRGSLANADALYRLALLIGDKNLIEKIQKAYLVTRKVRF